ncbi:class I SAM-dependent methyltransferase [Streptomyces sp. NBC_00986]|uniref:class I SAM-dependent methyltransferase n=1 Tax=Streptomyces sp. NBC_00986 TaxID=2903702 RepID=UPI00386D2993|nr:class I SAM-dependent methyltransferase [Streptomyces sp. NBC_00986]
MSHILLEKVLLKAQAGVPGAVLDIGCGTGDLAVKLALRGFTVTGIDLSEVAIRKAKERALGNQVADKVKFLVQDIESGKGRGHFAGQRFDLITCKLVYSFLRDGPAVLGWVRDRLTPDGCLVLITPVTRQGKEVTPRLRNISVDYDQLLSELHSTFTHVVNVHTEYFDDWGERKTFILRP